MCNGTPLRANRQCFIVYVYNLQRVNSADVLSAHSSTVFQ